MSCEELKVHNAIGLWKFGTSRKFLTDSDKWLIKLSELNKKKSIYPEQAFFKVLSNKWYDICNSSTKLGLFTWKKFWYSSLSRGCNIGFKEKIKFFIKCIFKVEKV